MNKNLKAGIAIAAGTAALATFAIATPSMAATKTYKAASSSSAPSFGKGEHGKKGERGIKAAIASVAATITGVPTTITDVEAAEKGARFVVYTYTDAAPTAQPTTGGHPAHLEGVSLANGVLTGTLDIKVGKSAATTKIAIYNSATSTTPVLGTVTYDATTGKATATLAGALTAVYTTPTAPAFGEGKGLKGDRDGDHARGGVTATVNLPTDGKTYSIRITEIAEKGVAVTNQVAKTGPAVTASGTVKLPLGASDTYKVELVAADGTVISTVTVTVAADGTVASPIVLG